MVNDLSIFAFLVLRVNGLTIFTFDVPYLHKCSTSVDLLELIEGEFSVGHWFDVWRRFFPSDAHNISAIRGLCNALSDLKL